jgi:hypothetical protein
MPLLLANDIASGVPALPWPNKLKQVTDFKRLFLCQPLAMANFDCQLR